MNLRVILGLAAALGLAGCYSDVKVVQGTVVTVAEDHATVTVRDERAPNATADYRLAARVTVAPGDVVRLAYRDRADGKAVVRLMNITRRDAKAQTEKH
jgi:hypothetical protein